MHSYLSIAYKLLLGIYKGSRIKLVKLVTFRLSLKIFCLCNFCFEMHYLFITKADRIAKREAFRLKRD